MNPSSPSTVTPAYALTTLEDTPRRVLDFVRGIGASMPIRKLMARAGYTKAVHDEGQRLLDGAVSFVVGPFPSAASTATSPEHAAAVAQLEAWERTVFRRLRAAVRRFYPGVAGALFANLKISDEMDTTLLVKIFLARISEKLPNGVSRLFEQRGFGADDIRHLKKLVATAEAPAPEADDDAQDDTEIAAEKATRVARLTALRVWYDDWAATARTVLTRRDYQMRVGIAHRKPAAKAIVDPPSPPSTPIVPPTPPAPTTSASGAKAA